MQRRTFLKGMSMLGLGLSGGQVFANFYRLDEATRAFDSAGVNFQAVSLAQLPRYINIFLYGGPSELAGNLTNIADINENSQNPYPASLLETVDNGGERTANDFWNSAGGDIMEELLASGDMTIYRTMNRQIDDSKGHGSSVTQNLVGSVDEENPGIATTLAWILKNNNPFDRPVDDLLFPFVTFEGESKVFNPGELEIPLTLKPVSLNSNLQNPYQRSEVGASFLYPGTGEYLAIEELAAATNSTNPYTKINQGFDKRAEFASQFDALLNPDTVQASIDTYNASLAAEGQISYEDSNFGRRIKAAVSLALANSDSVFISMGSGGLGGWDDHSEALDEYPARMSELMRAIRAGVRHLNAAADAGVGHAGNIIINVYGDFGRNVNLNNSLGWDHGNNQNLYTFGGKGITGRNLGQVVGTTERIGDSGQNRQYTTPTAASYQFEPYALAASMYHYFGVTNPDVITGVEPIDESAV